MKAYEQCDAIDLAQAVRRKEVSPEELLATAANRIRERNPAVNAVAWFDEEVARGTLSASDCNGLFYGVPLLVKDLATPVKGFPLQNGSRFYRGNVAAQDNELVQRYRRAGLVPLGVTTTPEFAVNCTTEGLAYGGPTRNPWDLSRSSGGSSGGAAVAVATGMVPFAHGGDGGGSLRIPASSCGLFGFKPTRMRNPMGPFAGEAWGSLAVDHVISRTVRDSAAALDATHGPDVGSPYAAPSFTGSYLQAVTAAPGRLRIGLIVDSPSRERVHVDCVAAAQDAARLCETLGHDVEPTAFPGTIDFQQFGHAMRLLVASGVASAVAQRTRELGREPGDDDLEVSIRTAVDFARRHSAVDYFNALALMHSIGRQMGRLMQTYDVLLTPTLAEPPVELGRYTADRDYVTHRSATLLYTAFLPYFNASGQPAMSVPLHWNKDNLPIGVQFASRTGAEDLLFSLAGQLEAARPWFDRRPPCAAIA